MGGARGAVAAAASMPTLALPNLQERLLVFASPRSKRDAMVWTSLFSRMSPSRTDR
jgi:hypothetical protein